VSEMKKLSGYVLLRETGVGIPLLLVAAYDSERHSESPASIYENKNAFQIDDLGRRIGSVLTDQDGKFVLSTPELEFEGNESRPDLLLVVLAPEDIQSIEHPFPLPAERRILYISAASIQDAGAEESLVIRLRQEQLDSFGITVERSTTGGASQGSRLASAAESAWSFNDTLRERLNPRMKQIQEKTDKRKQLAQERTKDLSAIALHLKDNKFLIKDKSDLKANLAQKQADAISEGLDRFAKLQPKLHLSLTPGDLSDLGLKIKDGKLTGKVDAKQLAAKARSLNKGVDLVRLRGFDNSNPDELEQKYLSKKTDENSNPPVR
jgi:hypothetical protein